MIQLPKVTGYVRSSFKIYATPNHLCLIVPPGGLQVTREVTNRRFAPLFVDISALEGSTRSWFL